VSFEAVPGESRIPEALTPEDIAKATFRVTREGYDKDEVEVFLHAVASDMSALKAELESARLGAHRPFEALGREMGALMQHAHDAARNVRVNAENEANGVLQKAQREVKRLKDEAETLKRKYQSEALIERDEANVVAERMKEQAEQHRRLAEAESSIMQQEARRLAKRIQDEAKRKANQIIAAAEGEGVERAKEAERRLRRLQEMDMKLRRRIEILTVRLQNLNKEVKDASPAIEKDEALMEDTPEPAGPTPPPSIRITESGTIRLDAHDETVG
jgi:DivIVA domain-containing protein